MFINTVRLSEVPKMRDNCWILDVLEDLRAEALILGHAKTAEMLDDAKLIALSEIAQMEAAADDEPDIWVSFQNGVRPIQ